MSVERILSEKGDAVVTIEPDRTLADVARLLSEKRIGAVVVSDERRTVLGIISERDIVRALAKENAEVLQRPVSQYMVAKPMTCTRAASVNELMEMMTNRRFRHVPVVEDERLVGMVSIGDIVKHRLEEIESEHKALRDYIATA